MKVHLWGELGFYGPGKQGRFKVTVEGETPILDLLRRIGVPWTDVAVAGLNGEVVRLEDPSLTVRDGDRLDLFPPSSGG
jgi:sulfur carrier protein ThiS